MEEKTRFIKQSYRFEDIRLLGHERLRDPAILAVAAAHLPSVYLSKTVKLAILVLKIGESPEVKQLK